MGGIELLGSAKLDGGRGREILRWRQLCLTWALVRRKRPGGGDGAVIRPRLAHCGSRVICYDLLLALIY